MIYTHPCCIPISLVNVTFVMVTESLGAHEPLADPGIFYSLLSGLHLLFSGPRWQAYRNFGPVLGCNKGGHEGHGLGILNFSGILI